MFSNTNSIDWGTLAQQWIQMKEDPNVSMPDPPPAPNITGSGGHDAHGLVPSAVAGRQLGLLSKKTVYEEQGEADMELADDEEHGDKNIGSKSIHSLHEQLPAVLQSAAAANFTQSGASAAGTVSDRASVMQSQWFMAQGGGQAPALIPPGVSTPLPPPAPQWNIWPPRVTVPPPTITAPVATNPTAHIPSLMKINVPNPNTSKPVPEVIEPIASVTAAAATTATANVTAVAAAPAVSSTEAARRKVLPAWIREGLEKMEREKQRQIEREQQNCKDDCSLTSPQRDIGNMIVGNELMVKESENILDSESSGNEAEDSDNNVVASQHIANAIEAAAGAGKLASETLPSSYVIEHDHHDNSDIDGEQISVKSYEQKLQDLMIVVRGTLTELLLEVTNDEITNIAQETLKSRKTKASSVQVIRKSDLTTITGKLGLAAYADSSSAEDESDQSEDERANDRDADTDSEEELQASIRMKRRTFLKIAEDIEQRVAAAAVREEQKLKYYTQLEQHDHFNDDKSSGYRIAHEHKRSHEIDRKCIGTPSSSSSSLLLATQLSSSGGKITNKRDFGETTTVSKLHHSNGKRHKDRLARKERTTRFSDNKEPKFASAITVASSINFLPPMLSSSNADLMHLHPHNTTRVTASGYMGTITAATSGSSVGGGASSDGGAHLNNILNAADVALEKVDKYKTHSSTSKRTSDSKSERHQRRHQHHHRRRRHRSRSHSHSRRSRSIRDKSSSSSSSHNSSSSTTSTQSGNTTNSSRSTPNSKYSHNSCSSATRQKRRRRDRDRSRKRTTSSSSSYRRAERNKGDSKSERHRRAKEGRHSSDSEGDRRKRHRSARPASTRSRSRSRSAYSSTNNNSNNNNKSSSSSNNNQRLHQHNRRRY